MVLSPVLIEKIKIFVTQEITKAWEAKGHNLTGSLIKELEYKASENIIEVLMNDYGIIQDVGVKAANVPYSGNGGGGTSKYIEGLMNYVSLRMGISKGTKENKSIAFAIAHTHKKTGIRTKERGQGSKWLTSVIGEIEIGLARIIEIEIGNDYEIQILKAFK